MTINKRTGCSGPVSVESVANRSSAERHVKAVMTLSRRKKKRSSVESVHRGKES